MNEQPEDPTSRLRALEADMGEVKSAIATFTGGVKVIRWLIGIFGLALAGGAVAVYTATVNHAAAITAIARDVDKIEKEQAEHGRDAASHPSLSTRVTTLEAVVPEIRRSLLRIEEKLDERPQTPTRRRR